MKEALQSLSEKLKTERLTRGCSFRQMAELIGISLNTYKRYENEPSKIRRLNAVILFKICKALNMRSDYLLGLDDESD